MIGKMIRFMRVTNNYKQADLSKKLNIAQTTLSGYETNYSNPDFDTIEKIAEQCNFEIVFRNKLTKEEFTTKSIKRKDF